MSLTNKHRKQGKSLWQAFSKTSNVNNDKQKQKINELQEEIRKLKTTQNITTKTANIDQTKINNPPQQNCKHWNVASAKGQQEGKEASKKRGQKQRPARKERLTQSKRLRGRKHENFIQLWRTTEDATRLQFDPAGNVINLRTKKFSRSVFKLLSKNLSFVPMQK